MHDLPIAETAPRTSRCSRGNTGPIVTVRATAMLCAFVPDIGLPLLAYYGLHLLGVSDWSGLLVATAVAGLRVAWVAVRGRNLNLFAAVMLVTFGLGTVLTLLSGDAKFLLLKNSLTTGAVGLVFLGTVVYGRPLTLAAAESFNPGRHEEFADQYRTDPRVRRGHRLSSTVWGAGLLVEGLARVPLVYLLPVSVTVGLGEALMIATMVGLTGWNIWYLRRARTARAFRSAYPGGEVDVDGGHADDG